MRSLRFCGFAVMILALMAMTPDVPAADGGDFVDLVMVQIGPAPHGIEAPAHLGLTFINMDLECLATESFQSFTAEHQELLVALLVERYGERPVPMPGRYRPGVM